jgi:hypothetical protein
MSKRKATRRSKPRIKAWRKPGRIVVAIALCLVVSGLSLSQWEAIRRTLGLAPSTSPAQSTQSGLKLAKEYIYAGGRLVATEEPSLPRSPYPNNTPHSIPGVIEAEDFDEGGEGVAYHDVDPTVNLMGAYRPSPSGVDIEACGASGSGCGFNVGNTWAGEWTEYTVNVASSGTYDIEMPVASGNGGGGTFHLALDGLDITGALSVPDTGGWQTYQTVRKAGVSMSAGQHVLRLSLDTEGPNRGVANFNFLRINTAAVGSPPTNLQATFDPNATPTQVRLTWLAPAGTIDHYEVERAQSPSGSYTTLSLNRTTADFIDTPENGVIRAYFYRVRAAFAGGGLSSYSNVDMATTIVFTDDPIQGGVTKVKAVHLNELRQAVNAVRSAAGLAAQTWTDSTLQGTTIKAVHVQELRTSLNQALTVLGLPTQGYTDPTLTGGATVIRKEHFQELRNRVK